MNTEDLFKYGVTPKEGENAGKRYEVITIGPAAVIVRPWGSKEMTSTMNNGSYDLWQPQKTLFEDNSIAPTWGNLKKAVEAAGLGDDTLFAVHDFLIGFRPAQMRTDSLHDSDHKEATYIIVE